MSTDTSSPDSTNLFQKSLGGTSSMDSEFLGPAYDYSKHIRAPEDIGMSGKGTLSALGKDVTGLIAYTQLLVEGTGEASDSGNPLGNKFFLITGQKCNDVTTNKQVDRSVYIDNVPSGNIPFISSGMGMNFSEFRGLIPGMISNLNAFSPYGMMQAFMTGSVPDCQPITMETIDVNNRRTKETKYVTTVDINNIDPCSFPDGNHPLLKTRCKQAFTNANANAKNSKCNVCPRLPENIFVQLYFAALVILGIYFLYRLLLFSSITIKR